MTDSTSEICCPPVESEKWDRITHVWKEKPFLVATVPLFLHIPFGFGKAVTRLASMAELHKIETGRNDTLLLSEDLSPWKSELYLSVTGPKPDLPIRTISGTFYSRVFNGNYNEVPAFMAEINRDLAQTDRKAKRIFCYYATCPKCAKKYGYNSIILFAEL